MMSVSMTPYDPQKIEPKWQKKWLEERTYEPDFDGAKKPFFNLMMFPYPSAEGLHVGNMYAFTGADVHGRFQGMKGNDVFEPIGLDGFGIHSENYAMKAGTHPVDQAATSEKRYYEQLQKIGNGFAWEERLETYDPEYYRWTQWLFVQMWKNGLAYRKKQSVNWCPKDMTVLADEQVEGGKCERCGSVVEKRNLEQWFFRITQYADRLLANLDNLDWSEKVKIAQKNWIGKSEGAEINFLLDFKKNPADNENRGPNGERAQLSVFTTRPDTLFGVTYLVLSPEHPWVTIATDNDHDVLLNKDDVKAYVSAARLKTEAERTIGEKEKTGVELKGVMAINPANGEEIPLWVADYVLGSYGTAAVMGVPGHDERDNAFAKKFNLPIREVIEATYEQTTEPGKIREGEPFDHRESIIAIVKHWKEEKYMALKWKQVAWGTFLTGGIEAGQTPEEAARMEIEQETGYTDVKFIKDFGVLHGKFYHVPKKTNRNAHAHVLYLELQSDTHQPVLAEEQAIHEVFWLSPDELKKFLTPDTHQHALRQFLGEQGLYAGYGTLANSGDFNRMESEEAKWKITDFAHGEKKTQFRLRDWLISRQRYWGPPIPMVHCDACAAAGKGEQKDMPGWYAVPEDKLPVLLPYVKDFRPEGSGVSPLASVKEFYETTCPECGGPARRETDVSDTFLDSAWYYLRYLDPKNATSALNADRVKKWAPIDMYIGGAEHSVLHLLYVRFAAMAMHDWGFIPFEEPFKKFRAHGLVIKDGAKMSKSKGNVINPDDYVRNFGADTLRMYLMFLAPFEDGGDFRDQAILGLERFLKRVWNYEPGTEKNQATLVALHKAIKKVGDDIAALHYNTAVSTLMIALNSMEELAATQDEFEMFLKLLAPFAPHITEEIWRERLGHTTSIHREAWPEYDAALLKEESVMLVVQVNGRTRAAVPAPADVDQPAAEALARANPAIQTYLADGTPKKIIYVPGKLINFVL